MLFQDYYKILIQPSTALTKILSPLRIARVAFLVPTKQGISFSLEIIAACEVKPLSSVVMAPAFLSVEAIPGLIEWATKISPFLKPVKSALVPIIFAIPVYLPGFATIPLIVFASALYF